MNIMSVPFERVIDLVAQSTLRPTMRSNLGNYVSALILLMICSAWTEHAHAGDAEKIVKILNSEYGNVCRAELNGVFSKTLKIEWTANTKKIHAIKVMAEIGGVKDRLYKDGVRYFQFPNDAGTYNIIDWKTGEKSSLNDRAKYHF
jgi:hypothetical protein